MSDTPNEKKFMREKVVKPPIDKRRAAGRILCYVLFAVVFGGVAAVSRCRIPAAFLRAAVRTGAIGGRFAPPRRRLIPQFCRLGRPAVRIVRLRPIFAIGMFRRPDSVPVGAMYNFNYLRR